MQNVCNMIGWNSVHTFDFFNCYRANINGMWNTRKLGGTWYMYKYSVKQHLIVLKLDSVSINKILVTKFVTVKVSQNLNLMQTLSIKWNQQLSRYIVIRNGKIVWKHGPYYWYFRLNLKYLGWPYREFIKTVKKWWLCEELLSETDFEANLTTFCCYSYGANAFEAVQKISTDQKDYRKCSSCVIVCWIARIYQLVNYLLGHLRRS